MEEDINQVGLRFGFARPTSTPSRVILLGVCAVRWLPIVLLLNMRVQRRVTQIAFAAATVEGAANIVIFTSSFTPHLLKVRRVSVHVVWVYVVV